MPLLAALLLAAPAAGQETRDYDLPDLERPPDFRDHIDWRLTAANRFVGSADYGSFSTTAFEPEGRLRFQLPVSERGIVRFLATGRVIIQDFDGPSDLFGTGPQGGDPFSDLTSWTLRVQGAHLLPEWLTLFSEIEQWGLIVQGTAKAAYEGGSAVRHGFQGGGSLGFLYRYADRFELVAGVNLTSRLFGDGVSVSPFFEFDWKLARHWRLRSYGVGLQLERLFGDDLALFLRARLESSRYRLDDRPGGIGRGAVRFRDVPVGLGLRWNLLRKLQMTVVAGAVTWGELRVENGNEDEIGRETAGPAPYLSLRFDLRD